MEYEAVVFDLDGTLLNTLDDIANVVNQILAERGHAQHPLDAYRGFLGHGVNRLLANALPSECQDDQYVEGCVLEFFEKYSLSSCDTSEAYSGVPELLRALESMGVRLAILSNKPHELTVHCVAELLGDWNFEIVYGHRKGSERKPSPESLNEIVQLLSLSEDKILFVGDTVVDVQTAIRAKVHPVGVAWGYQGEKFLVEAGAAKILQHPLDLLEYWKADEQ